MTKWYRENAPITAENLTSEWMRLKRGSVTRRHFLGVTGLGLAAAVLARQPGIFSSAAYARRTSARPCHSRHWPNYHDPASFEAFTAATGVAVEVNVFGSNEEMLAKLQAGGTGWDLFVPTNYTISTYVEARPDRPARHEPSCRPSRRHQNRPASPPKARSTARPTPCRRTGARPALPSTPPRSRRKSPRGKTSSRSP